MNKSMSYQEKFWKFIEEYSSKKVRQIYMRRVRHDRKCPNCKRWTSEVGGCATIFDEGSLQLMKCKQCNYVSRWDCSGMMPMLDEFQLPNKPRAD